MIGLDFPIKPQWIHDVHQLWTPNEPISNLISRSLVSTMQELGGEKTRRNSLGILLRYYVATEGSGSARRTSVQDLWVVYSQKYTVSTLAPVYLVQIIANNELASEIIRFITRRYTTSDTFKSEELKRHIIGKYGERKVVTNAVSAFLRTLQYFSVLEPVKAAGEYRVCDRLTLNAEIFPLAFYALWSLNPVPQIDFDTFNQLLIDSFISGNNLDDCWKRHQPNLWTISERVDARFAIVKYPNIEDLKSALLNLVSIN